MINPNLLNKLKTLPVKNQAFAFYEKTLILPIHWNWYTVKKITTINLNLFRLTP